jgi:Ca2+-transporting ATPase
MAFAAIVCANIALLFVTRSRERPVLGMLREPNPALWWIAAGAFGALLASIYLVPVAAIFRFAPIAPAELAAAALAGVLGVAWYEARKLLRRRRSG